MTAHSKTPSALQTPTEQDNGLFVFGDKEKEALSLLDDAQKIHRVCFVCTGNTCRSPMAAALYNHIHEQEPTHAKSAGLAAMEGEPIAAYAKEALSRYGVKSTPKNDYTAHRATSLTDELVSAMDDIYALSSAHYMALCMTYPEHISKFHILGEIADPYGGTLALYEKTLAEIAEALHV